LISIENLADSPMTDVNVKLDLSAVDIASSNEVAEKKLRLIDAGGISDIIFSIKALPGAKGGIYKVPYSLSYTDQVGNRYNQTGFISIQVAGESNIIATVDSTAISKSNRIGDVDIKLVNSGLTNIGFLTVEIQNSKNYKVLSNNLVYIGSIDSDDFGTATFKLSVKTGNDFEIPIKLSYRDVLNNKYSDNFNVTLKMLSDAELGKKSSLPGILISILIIFALLLIFIKKLRERVLELVHNFLEKK
jgi:hypothetical protein